MHKISFCKTAPKYTDSLPNDKYLDWSKLKAFADDKMNVGEKLIFMEEKIENIVGQGENAGNQHFLLVPQCFQKASFSRSLKERIIWEWVKQYLSLLYFIFLLSTRNSKHYRFIQTAIVIQVIQIFATSAVALVLSQLKTIGGKWYQISIAVFAALYKKRKLI